MVLVTKTIMMEAGDDGEIINYEWPTEGYDSTVSTELTFSNQKLDLTLVMWFMFHDCLKNGWNMKYYIKVGLSNLKKIVFLLQLKLFKNIEKCFFNFISKALFILIFKLLSRLFGHVEKTAWLER